MVETTILMPVYNGEKYLKEAIDSMLTQTYTDFELLIINDASTDYSKLVAESYDDKRVKVVTNEQNLGLIGTLNKGFELIDTKYIARMDQDDIAYPDRLQKQIDFLNKNPDVDICGCWIDIFNEQGVFQTNRYPEEHVDIRKAMFTYSALPHPGLVIRNQTFKDKGIRYSDDYKYAEDYELWTRIVDDVVMHNLPEVLLKYRYIDGNFSSSNKEAQEKVTTRIKKGLFARELETKSGYKYGDKIEEINKFKKIFKVAESVLLENEVDNDFSKKVVLDFVSINTHLGFTVWLTYKKSVFKFNKACKYKGLFIDCILKRERAV